jgi:hypothetical protein
MVLKYLPRLLEGVRKGAGSTTLDLKVQHGLIRSSYHPQALMSTTEDWAPNVVRALSAHDESEVKRESVC